MDLLYSHQQEKREKSTNLSSCDLKLYRNDNELIYASNFDLDYRSYGTRKHIRFEHQLTIRLKTGNINTRYRIINDGITKETLFRNLIKDKDNDFNLLDDLLHAGFLKGEKKLGYWGVKYSKSINDIFEIIYSTLHPKLKTEHHIKKNYREDRTLDISLYELVVDFHLDMKGIKGHDSVYFDILHDYPKKKWLIKNDNKFLPSVLEEHGIKTKYFIGELNKKSKFLIIIRTLKYLCALFGDNYIDYIKQFSWKDHCHVSTPNKKLHVLKNESEKKTMVETLKKWYNNEVPDPFIPSINKLLTTREKLKPLGYILKYGAKNYEEFENLAETWNGHKKHITRGYKLKYDVPPSFIEQIEQDIVIGDNVFKPKILLTEEDYRIEGYLMKNCMGKQFSHGAIYFFVGLEHKRKRINLQYRKGRMSQSYGRANTTTPEIFNEAIVILNSRFIKYPNITPQRVKYEFIKKSK